MFILGLTGSIAMGKTTTARLFAEEGVPVHDADAAVHRLYEGEAAAAIEAAFPGTTKDGKVDRAALSRHIVGDPGKLRFLESIVHPLVAKVRDRFLADAEAAGAKVAVLDIPLLFETGGESRVDAVVVASAPAEKQRARLLERGLPPERIEALLMRQMPDAEKRRRADFVVDTSRGIEHAREQVKAILAAVAKMPPRARSPSPLVGEGGERTK
jgi:dephospho-CoA kinase